KKRGSTWTKMRPDPASSPFSSTPAPSHGIQIPKKECLLSTELNSSDRTADFSSDKSLATDRAFMIEQDSIRSMKAVGLAVIYRDPIGIQFRGCIWRSRVKRCGLALGSFLHVAV